MRFLLKGAKGSTKKLAQDLGVSQRTVQRWLKGQGTPKPAAAKAIEKKVRAGWQPRVKQRVRRAPRRTASCSTSRRPSATARPAAPPTTRASG
ncbi:helix-turn-helix domain-containing protein [Kitasatospora aureofaciens]|uniref:helix-turn-helix domain-containing protein n=1 Tax=Kitasatospora aureofaciens TaxID=1894 RepID=UPI001F22E1E5|nr:helix-turn-helix transcriptional regulator [Kitasatospora aureofaciens]